MKSRSFSPFAAFSLKKCFHTNVRNAAACCVTLFSFSASLEAASLFWDGGGVAGTDLGTNTNWDTDVLPNVAIPDTAQWNNTVTGPLSLVYSNTAFAGAAGNPGINLEITAANVSSLNLDSGANTGSFRMNGLNIVSGAGAVSFGNGSDVFSITLGGAAGTHTWVNDSTNPAVVNSDVVFGLGGGGAHTLALGGAGNWSLNNSINLTTLTIAKNGAGTATINGTTNNLASLQVNGGVLDLAKDVTLAGAVTIISGSGGTINSTGGGKILLNVAAGDLGVANGGTLTINSVIANGTQTAVDFYNTAAGTGVVVLNADNTFSGITSLQSGVISVPKIGDSGAAGPLGTNGTINIGAGTGGATLRYTGTGETNNRIINLAGTTGGAVIDQSGTGNLKFIPNPTATGAGAKTLTLQGSTAGTGELPGNIINSTAATNVAKAGSGTWTLGGINTYTGTTAISGGTLNHTGTLGLTGTAAGAFTLGASGSGNATLNLPTASNIKLNNANMLVGAGITNTTGQGFVNQAGGIVSGVNQLQLGAGASGGSYGYYKLADAGSTLGVAELDLGGFNGAGVGVLDISAGTLNAGAWIVPARGAGGTGILNMTGGTLNYNGPATQFRANWNGTAGSTTAINIANATLNAPLANINLMDTGVAGKLGEINLLPGGLLQANGIAPGSATGTSLVNFNGGTLKANAANANFLTTNLTGAFVYGGGGTIHNNNVNITLAVGLLAPTASGVASVAITSGGSGYQGPPAVTFSGPSGIGASGYATVSGGVVTGIVITNPGTGYTAPVVTLTGGGGTGAATGAISLAANTSGGMAFQGTGITTLSGTSTYTGATSITAGTIDLTGTLGSAGGTAITSSATLTEETFGVIAGTSSLTLTAGSATLNGTNTYTGATTINGGVLTISGNGSLDTSSAIVVNGADAKIITTSSSTILPPVTLTKGLLDGTGDFSSVTVGNGTGGVIANGNGTTSALVIDNLTFNGAATVNLNTNSTSTIISTTNLATNAAGNVTVNATNVSWANGSTYNLIGYSGAIGGGGFGKFVKGTITGLGARQSATLVNSGSAVRLSIAGDTPVWTGALSPAWTTNVLGTPKNWKLQTAGTTTDFINSDAVLFSDAATGTTAVSISTASVNTTSIIFSNTTAKAYSISSPGAFGIASGSILKNGNGIVSLNTANTYAGSTTLNDGILNINNPSSIGTGAFLFNAGSIDNTSGSPVTLSTNNAQTWTTTNITFGGTNSLNLGTGNVAVSNDTIITTNGTGTFTVGGSLSSGTYGLTKEGTGALSLGGSNLYSGVTFFNAGRLNINNASGIGTSMLFIQGGTQLDNTSGAPVTLTTNNTQQWISDFTFLDSNDLFMGTGAVSLGGSGKRTVTVSGGNLGTGPVTSFGQDLAKAGGGALRLDGGNSFIDGVLDIQAGIVGSGGDFTAAGLSGTGILENGTVNSKWSFWNVNTDQSSAATIRDGFGGGLLGIVKRGTATWTLTNNANHATSNLTVDTGKLILNNTGTYGAGNPGDALATNLTATVGNTSGQNGVLEINGAAVNFNNLSNADAAVYRSTLSIGTSATGAGAVHLSSGSLTSYRQLAIGSVGGAYGAYTQTGGIANVGGFLAIGLGNATGSFTQTGGTFNMTLAPVTNGAGTGSVGVMTIGGTAVFNHNSSGDSGIWIGEAGTGRLDVSGTAALNIAATNNGLQLGRAATGSGNVNLLGGTITTPKVYKGAGTGTFNFNGGILKPNVASTTFMEGLTSTYVRSGGAVIDTDTFDTTIAQPLLAPTASGVSATGLTYSGGGYIDTPVVIIAGDGTGATATAQIDGSGNLTGITVTNRGVGYTTPPTFTLLGGGTGNTGALGGTATLVTPAGGGLTKAGAGTLTLTGANTYSGDTVVTGGTLSLGTAYLADAADVRLSLGTTLNLNYAGTDTVDELYINGVSQASGNWGAIGSGATHESALITGAGLLNITNGAAASPYAAWALAKGLTGANNGATQDPDFDGIANALEFVLGGNPLASDTAKLPVLTTDATNYIFTFTREDASESEIGLTFQWGSTLTGWTDVPVVGASSSTPPATVTVTENTTSPDTVVVTVPKTSAVGGKLFGRLKAVK